MLCAMRTTISALEDTSSSFYRGRAFLPAFADTARMENSDWRGRLASVIQDKKLSKRSVSLKSGNGAGYVHSILAEGKEPTVDKLRQVCEAIPVSMAYILYGFDVTPEDEKIIAQLHESPETRGAVLTLLGAKRDD